MSLDIRIPIGLLFIVVGSLLAALGGLGDKTIYARSLGLNVNLWWGFVMLFVGALFLRFARRGVAPSDRVQKDPVDGEALETRKP